MINDTFGRRELLKRAAVATSLGALGTTISRPALAAGPVATVPLKPLGTTGQKIPILLLGAGKGYDLIYDKVLHTALREGAFYIDTAESYANGQSHVSVGNFLEPKIQGDSLDLHPVTILVALIFWGMLWGIVGMFLAVPMTAILKILMEPYTYTRPFAQLMAGKFERWQL